MRAPETASKPRVNCPRGAHLARLVQIVDLGSQHFTKGDEASRKLYFGFETCDAKHTFKDEKGPEPFMLQVEFAFYMTSANPQKPTKLRQFLIQWFGKDFSSEQEAKEFDFSKLLGRVAMLTVAHKPKTSGGMKAVIADIYAATITANGVERAMKSSEAPPAVNPLVCYEIGNGEDENFRKLPPFLQKKIKESDEFARGAQEHDDQPDDDPATDENAVSYAPAPEARPMPQAARWRAAPAAADASVMVECDDDEIPF